MPHPGVVLAASLNYPLASLTLFEKDRLLQENFPEIRGSHRDIRGRKYTTDLPERSGWAKELMR